MADITKLNLYLSEQQYQKLSLLAESLNKEPEEVANNAVYGYLAIADPFVEEHEPPQDMTEIMFDITDAEAAEIEKRLEQQGLDDFDLDSYAKYLLLRDLHSSLKI